MGVACPTMVGAVMTRFSIGSCPIRAGSTKAVGHPAGSRTVGEAIHPLIEGVQDEVINYVEAGDDHYRCDLATPVFVLNELGYNSITVWLTGSMADQNNNPSTSEKPNVFTVLKNAARQYLSYPESREEKNQKDVLFNKVVACLKNNNVGFTPLQVNTTGLTVATNLTSITAGDLEENIDKLGQLLIMPWILNPKFATFKTAVENLSDGLKKYKGFLKSMTHRTKANMDSTTPVRNLNDSWILKIIEGSITVAEDKYSLLLERLGRVGLYEPIDLCDIEPLNKEERRKWLNKLSLPFPVSQFTFSYGNYLGNLNILWKIPADLKERKADVECSIVQEILKQVSMYKTRRMQKDFVDRYSSFAKPVVLRNMFQFLTECEYSPQNETESEIDLRLCEYLLQNNETELIIDLRKNNGRPLSKEFDQFWSALDNYLTEKSVVHERRQSDVNYMPFAMSVEDLQTEIANRLPQGSKIPSVSWMKLNFYPRNPYKNSAINYTGKFKVKFKVQQRLLRATHEDSDFARNQFGLLKNFACKFRDLTSFQCLDDKAIVPVGEPGHAVSTGVRIHHGGIVTASGQNIAMDHDFHIAGIVPSVCFNIDIPSNPNDSFYNGIVNVTVKDKVFESSNPLRHSTESVSIIRKLMSNDDINMEKPILIRYTDGGPDHRVTYRSVQLCSLLEFIALDLDMIVCARTAPAMSYLNPAERTMSVLNLALQNVALQREKMQPEFEMMAKGKTLKGLRTVSDRNAQFKEKYSESASGPIEVIRQRFAKLKWKGEPFIIHEAASTEEMNRLLELLKVIDGDVEVDGKNLTKLKSQQIDRFLAKHARCRHYIYQIKKCVADDCAYCTINPPRIPEELFKELYFVPDPTVNTNGYTPFDELYGTETDDSGRPSLTLKPQSTERDKKFRKLLTGRKTMVFDQICIHCGDIDVVETEHTRELQEQFGIVRPICQTCLNANRPNLRCLKLN
ncbi:hypothetical protein MAR_013619 [Mya arenaria]|uniref:Uncharacterized protein n=1 Tax=Mya arenaria TaxID=6604 RepID=A0ABY7G107_MYAAR|nr:hypothetical protein MAR_013619 [Mya arenaria]